MAARISSRVHKTPIPVGPSILWPEKTRKSTSSVDDVGRRVRDRLRAVDRDQRAVAWASLGELPRSG